MCSTKEALYDSKDTFGLAVLFQKVIVGFLKLLIGCFPVVGTFLVIPEACLGFGLLDLPGSLLALASRIHSFNELCCSSWSSGIVEGSSATQEFVFCVAYACYDIAKVMNCS